MQAHDRIEFFHDRHAIWIGCVFLLFAIPLTGTMVADLLGLWHMGSEGSNVIERYWSYLVILMGAYNIFGGLAYLWIGFDRRPVVVLDHEGLFYRPHGAIIAWTDIRAVETNTKDDRNDIILQRFSGPATTIDVRVLSGYGEEGPLYIAIVQGWQRYRRNGNGWHVATDP